MTGKELEACDFHVIENVNAFEYEDIHGISQLSVCVFSFDFHC